jgi:hypothetical protein
MFIKSGAPRGEGGESMKNAVEKAAIAKSVASYVIDHLLVEEPMSATELEALVVDITQDRGVTEDEIQGITRMAIDYVSKDGNVEVKSKGKEGLWLYHK